MEGDDRREGGAVCREVLVEGALGQVRYESAFSLGDVPPRVGVAVAFQLFGGLAA